MGTQLGRSVYANGSVHFSGMDNPTNTNEVKHSLVYEAVKSQRHTKKEHEENGKSMQIFLELVALEKEKDLPLKHVSLFFAHLTSTDRSYSWPAPRELFFLQMTWS